MAVTIKSGYLKVKVGDDFVDLVAKSGTSGGTTSGGTTSGGTTSGGTSTQRYAVTLSFDETQGSVTCVANGSTVSSGSTVPAGTVLSVTATPKSGYSWTGWSGSSTSTDQTISLTVNGNVALAAQFAEIVPVKNPNMLTTWTGTSGGLTMTQYQDDPNAVSISGTTTSATNYPFFKGVSKQTLVPGKTYTFTCKGISAGTKTLVLASSTNNTSFSNFSAEIQNSTSCNLLKTASDGSDKSYTFTLPESFSGDSSLRDYLGVRCYLGNNATYDGMVIYAKLEEGSEFTGW